MPKTFKQLNAELDAIQAEWDASTVRWDRLVARIRAFTALAIVGALLVLALLVWAPLWGTD